jgi:DNA polymerase
VAPDVVVCLGGTAVKSLLGGEFRVLRDRGRPILRETSLGERTFVISVHPSSILRGSPEDRDRAFAAHVADLRVVAELTSSLD